MGRWLIPGPHTCGRLLEPTFVEQLAAARPGWGWELEKGLLVVYGSGQIGLLADPGGVVGVATRRRHE